MNTAAEFDAKAFVSTLPQRPGVYRMLDLSNTVIYVGKAKNLKKRVASYFTQAASQVPKTRTLVRQITAIEITVTHTESEALILESTLIKQYQPRYNVLLRDDKSYPYLYLSADPFPRLSLHRGAKRNKGRYFGPYPHARAVHESLNLLQKIFPIRQCENSFFRNRSRPCLQYQIKRCSGPCVGLIDPAAYQKEVQRAILFLEGRNQEVISELVTQMNAAAAALEYEQAATYRDQISTLRTLQEQQSVSTDGGDIDIVACINENGSACVQVMTVRGGRQLGSRGYFPKHTHDQPSADIMAAFLAQYYLTDKREVPSEIICQYDFPDLALLANTLSELRQRQIRITANVRGLRSRWLAMAEENARSSLAQRRPNQYRERLAALSIALQLDSLPNQLECFDISHSLGEATVAACVVFNQEGPNTGAYRRFNIEGITPGDDLAAIQQAVKRRYQRLQKEAAPLPEVIFIDGGRGQVETAQQVLHELGIDGVRLLGVAKGTDRKAGLESLILPNEEKPLLLPADSPALQIILHIRDEAHRFALNAHRQRRTKARQHSSLEHIAGIGSKRRQQLLHHFGGLQGVARAGVEDLAKVPGISRQLAQKIYDFFLTT